MRHALIAIAAAALALAPAAARAQLSVRLVAGEEVRLDLDPAGGTASESERQPATPSAFEIGLAAGIRARRS
ncbi:MAG: hypothetical protein WDN24_21530 [Sphingomonas sp.]